MALRTWLKVAVCSVLLTAAYSNISHATTLTYNTSAYLATNTGHSADITLVPFDPNIGTLDRVTMHIDREFSAYANFLDMDNFYPIADMSSALSTDIIPMGLTFLDTIYLFVYYEDFLAGDTSRSGSIHDSGVYTTTSDLSNFEYPGEMHVRTSFDFPLTIAQEWELNGVVNLTYAYDYTPVPEPSTIFLVAAGLIAICVRRKRATLNS